MWNPICDIFKPDEDKLNKKQKLITNAAWRLRAIVKILGFTIMLPFTIIAFGVEFIAYLLGVISYCILELDKIVYKVIIFIAQKVVDIFKIKLIKEVHSIE